MSTDHWKHNSMPTHDGHGWAIYCAGRKQPCLSAKHTLERIGKWLPTNPMLVAAPGMPEFVPPIAIPEFESRLHDGVIRYWRMLVAAVALVAIMFTIPRAFPVVISSSALAVMFLLEYRFLSRSAGVVLDRALFFYWLHNSPRARAGILSCIVFASVVGLVQVIAQETLGSMEAAFHTYGLMYPAARGGEYWRILTGPFLHYGVLHFIANAMMLIFAGWVAFAIRPAAMVAAFFLGCWISAWCQMTFGGQVYDNFGGMSGGVFAVCALLVTSGAIDRRALPTGLAVLFGSMAVVSGLISELLSETVATVAHLAGAATGAAIALIVHRARPHGRRSTASPDGARP